MVDRLEASELQRQADAEGLGGDEVTVIDQRDDAQKAREEEILTHVLHDYEIAKTERSERETTWDRYFEMYMCHLNHSKYPWKSKVFDPESFAAIETINPRIINTLIGGPEVFGIKPTGQEDVQKARKSKMILDYQADRMDLYTRMGDISKDGLIYGTSFGKLRWKKDFEPRMVQRPVLDGLGMPVSDPQTGQPMMKMVKEFVNVYDDPALDRVDIKSIYIDPGASEFADARFAIHELRRTFDYLKKKEAEGIYFNVDLIPHANASTDNTTRDSDPRKAINHQTNAATSTTLHDRKMDEVTLLEYWGMYDIDGDGYLEECIIVVANGTIVIRAEYNPFPGGFKPFLRFTPVPIPGSFYGMSLLQPIEGIQEALNDRTNQIADNISLLINRMFKYNKHADINPDELVMSPGGMIGVNQMNDIEMFDVQDIIGSVFPEVGRLESKIQKALGTYDYAAGGAPQRQEAATTVISLQQVAEIRFKTIAVYFERQIIRPLGNMMLKMNKRMLTKPREIRILGREAMMPYDQPQFETISSDDIVENPDIYAVGAAIDPTVSKQMQLDSLMKFMTIVGGNPQLMMSPMFGIDWSVIIEELPYLLDIKLKRPLVLPNNPELAYSEMKADESLADGMLMQNMGMMQSMALGGGEGPPQGESVPDKTAREAPSRTKGEVSKKKSGVRGKNPKK